ncbi:hypothetical protein Tco_1170620 [Tanacetum coccineum]
MHDTLSGGDSTVLLCWITQDFELIAAFDPLADKIPTQYYMAVVRISQINHKKTVKSEQARTRESEEYKAEAKPQPKP